LFFYDINIWEEDIDKHSIPHYPYNRGRHFNMNNVVLKDIMKNTGITNIEKENFLIYWENFTKVV